MGRNGACIEPAAALTPVIETREAHAVKEFGMWVGVYEFWHNGRWYESPIALADYADPKEKAVDLLTHPDYIATARLAFLRDVKLSTRQ